MKLNRDITSAENDYEKAIQLSRENQFLQHEAIACEVAARFHEGRGLTRLSRFYLQEARNVYIQWGALAKVRQLEDKNPGLTAEMETQPRNPAALTINHLDAITAIQAAQAISSEMVLPRLLKILIKMLVENAGAERGCLLKKQADNLALQASARLEGNQIMVEIVTKSGEALPELPETIINYTSRTGEKVILSDARKSHQFAHDPYILRHSSRSVLCLPIKRQSVLVGLIYLENNQISGAFTDEKLAILQLLSSQAAISLENASLYSALHDSEQKYRTLFENSGNPLVFIEEDGIIAICNKEFEMLTGYSKEEIEGQKKWTDFSITWEDLHRMRQYRRQRMEDPASVESAYEIQFTDRFGNVKEVFITITVIPGTAKMLAAFLDITRRKQAEKALKDVRDNLEIMVTERTSELNAMNQELISTLEQLTAMQKQLIQSEKKAALGNLVAGIAHEINTPVGVGVTVASALNEMISNYAEAHAQLQGDAPELQQLIADCDAGVKLILNNLEKAARLIRSFKEVSVDQFSESKRVFNVYQYLNEILLSMHPQLKHYQHKISVLCDENLDVYTYPGGFAQIIGHLLNNSLSHAFAKDTVGNIRIEIKSENQQFWLIYSDDGRGMEKQVLAKIFDPFFTTKRGSGSIGLGLHVIYNIVTIQMEGSIECSSEPGQGTRFVIRIPLEE